MKNLATKLETTEWHAQEVERRLQELRRIARKLLDVKHSPTHQKALRFAKLRKAKQP